MQEIPAFLKHFMNKFLVYMHGNSGNSKFLMTFPGIEMLPIPTYPHTRKHGISLKFSYSGYLSKSWGLELISFTFSNQETKLFFLWSCVTRSILGSSLDSIKIYALDVHSTTEAYKKLHSLLLMQYDFASCLCNCISNPPTRVCNGLHKKLAIDIQFAVFM